MTRAAVRDVIERLGVLQIDGVTVVAPAHHLVLFSRLGPYPTALLEEAVRRREITEQWAHEAAFVPMADWPLFAERRATHRVRPYGFERWIAKNAAYCDAVLAEVHARGPLTFDLVEPPPGAGRIPGSWHGSYPRAVLESHFGFGRLAVAGRTEGTSRVYDLAERVVPRPVFSRAVPPEEARDQLLLRAAKAHGVGTVGDLADYYRMPARGAAEGLRGLVARGAIEEVRVAGWRERAFRHPAARAPRIRAARLLAPFDPLVWFRPRTERLFGFEYRNEIFTPPEKRRWGAYVLPFLLEEALVARVDAKADRVARRLRVRAAFLEEGQAARRVATPLLEELRLLSGWLGLDGLEIEGRDPLSRALRSAG